MCVRMQPGIFIILVSYIILVRDCNMQVLVAYHFINPYIYTNYVRKRPYVCVYVLQVSSEQLWQTWIERRENITQW